MQTWLDSFVGRLHGDLMTRIAGNTAAVRSAERQFGKRLADITPVDSARHVILSGLSRLLGVNQIIQHLLTSVFPFVLRPSDLESLNTFQPGGCWDRPRAVRVTADLVADLVGARAPSAPIVTDMLDSYRWYLDFPHRALLLGDDMQVRAVWTTPISGAPNHWAVLAVVTKPGSNDAAARFSFIVYPDGATGEITIEDQIGGTATGITDALAAAAAETLGDLVRLVVAYDAVAEPQNRQPVPQVTARDLSGCRKASQKLKKFTLFKVTELRSPAGRFGRNPTAGAAGGGWQLTQRVRVRGHFKMQAHGAGRVLRKLVYVEPYERGPADSQHDHRHDLVVLRPSDSTTTGTATTRQQQPRRWRTQHYQINADPTDQTSARTEQHAA